MLYANGQPVGGGGAGGNTNSVELTYAEYLALSDAEKMNGTEYFITDINGDGSQFQPVIYSTDEREIGVWVDGKPLYERTYIGGTIPASSNLDISIDTTNVDEIFISKAITYSSTQGYSLILNDVIPTYSAHSKRIYINKNASKIVIDNGDTDNFYDRTYVTVIYTKTTDAAGSGTWTPQGVPAVHYSTDEQVIGTYLGDTLCQKTIHNVSITSGIQWIDTGIDSTCKIIETKGVLFKSGGDIVTMPCADSGSSTNDLSVAGINTCSVGIVTTGKWAVLFRTLKSDMRGDLDLTVIYTKSS